MMMIQPPLADESRIEPIGQCTAMKVRRLARRVTQMYDEALAPYGLTVGQIGLLMQLRRRQGIGISDLADRLSADASTISRLLRPLCTAGLILVEPDPDDGRAKCVRLTDTGADRRRTAVVGWELAQRRVAAALGSGRLAALHFSLDDAHSHLSTPL